MTDATSNFTADHDPLLERSLLDVGIPPCPEILLRIMDEMHKDEPDYHLLSKYISTDVALAAGLIKTTNSPYFIRQQRARSVHDALTILGLRTASHTIAGLILRQAFPSTPQMLRFWDASARNANLCAWLAHRLDLRGLAPDDAHTFGLFHDCGIAILMNKFPNYRDVLAEANNDDQGIFTAHEDRAFKTNHALIGSALAQNWWLPEEFRLGIRHHHDPSALQPGSMLPKLSQLLISTTQFAEHISQSQIGMDMSQEWGKLEEHCLKLLKLDTEDLDFLYDEGRKILETEAF